jgi:hypothetical protein
LVSTSRGWNALSQQCGGVWSGCGMGSNELWRYVSQCPRVDVFTDVLPDEHLKLCAQN